MRATWEKIKSQISSEIPKNSFSLWINPVNFLEKNDKAIILGCPNKFSCQWVMENYLGLIRDKLKDMGSTTMDILLKVETQKRKELPFSLTPDRAQLTLPNMSQNGGHSRPILNKEFTFDRFIVGDSNEFAYSVSNALANGNVRQYHSLLMLANTGLGKTHLSHAMGHAIYKQNPQAQVYYITAEDFTNEIIFSLKNNRIDDFKNKYRRSCDVLILEEIHFLSGKEKTQEELGHTLDALANDKKKVVFTSSLPPKDIPRLAKELSSRLTSGLIATIENPNYETRIKIITKKSLEHKLLLSEDVIHFLASRLKRDIRQMESALNSLKAKSELLKVKINLNLAKDVVNCLVSGNDSISPAHIKKLVSKYYKIGPDILSSKSRKKAHSYPRNIYAYLSRQHTDVTFEDIAKTINRSHSAVLYASELIEHRMKHDAKLRNQVTFLTKKIEEMKK